MQEERSTLSTGVCTKCGPENHVTYQTVTLIENDGWSWTFKIECACGEVRNYRHLRQTSGELQGSLDWNRVRSGILAREEVSEIL